MEHFVIIVNGFPPLTIITKSSTLDVAAVLDPTLVRLTYYVRKVFRRTNISYPWFVQIRVCIRGKATYSWNIGQGHFLQSTPQVARGNYYFFKKIIALRVTAK